MDRLNGKVAIVTGAGKKGEVDGYRLRNINAFHERRCESTVGGHLP